MGPGHALRGPGAGIRGVWRPGAPALSLQAPPAGPPRKPLVPPERPRLRPPMLCRPFYLPVLPSPWDPVAPNRGQARDVQSSPSWLRAGAPEGPSGLLWDGSQAAHSASCPEPRDPSRRGSGWAVVLVQPQVPACSRAPFPFLCPGFLRLEGSCWSQASPRQDATSPSGPPAPAPRLVSGFPSQQRWPSRSAPPRPGIPCPLSTLLPHQVATPLQGPPLPNSSSQALLPAATSGWGV